MRHSIKQFLLETQNEHSMLLHLCDPTLPNKVSCDIPEVTVKILLLGWYQGSLTVIYAPLDQAILVGNPK
jgi:hypothetical protein